MFTINNNSEAPVNQEVIKSQDTNHCESYRNLKQQNKINQKVKFPTLHSLALYKTNRVFRFVMLRLSLLVFTVVFVMLAQSENINLKNKNY